MGWNSLTEFFRSLLGSEISGIGRRSLGFGMVILARRSFGLCRCWIVNVVIRTVVTVLVYGLKRRRWAGVDCGGFSVRPCSAVTPGVLGLTHLS